MKKILSFLLAFSTSVICFAQAGINIIPEPAEIIQPKIAADFTITPATEILLEGSGLENSANFFNDYLQQCYHFKLKVVTKASSKNVIALNFERMDNPIAGAYTLSVNAKGVYIAGDNQAGAFYGIQTLIQLLPVEPAQKLSIPYVSIKDYPRFSYRGLMLDCGRHFFSVDFVKKYIDYIALHKMNFFHWHLTEDQGWRIEIKKYPKLTEVGSNRNGTIIGRYPGKGSDNQEYGGFYTQEQIKDIVKYAADRYITVIPEIEMPGHGSAAIAAYPQLSCFPDTATIIKPNMISDASKQQLANGRIKLVQETWGVFKDVYCPSDYTFNFLQDVIDELIPLFPAKYIHIGGDECPKDAWKESAFCQNLIKENNLKDEHGLQSYFIGRIEKYINSKGKQIIGWDEILEGGLAPNATVMSWRGEKGGIEAAKQNHDVIMTPTTYVYFDYSQTKKEDSITIGGFLPLDKVYNYEPIPAELTEAEGKHVLGGQANLWSEYVTKPEKAEYMIFPRLSALSEVLWSPKAKKSYSAFEKKLQIQFKRYELWKANYSKAYFELHASILPDPNNKGILWQLETKIKNAEINYATGINQTALPYKSPLRIDKSENYVGILFINNKVVSSIHEMFLINKATGKKISLTTEPAKNWPGNGGAFGLVNGVVSDKDIGSSEWLGWQGNDMEATIDLGNPQSISKINCHLLESKDNWIHLPAYVEAFTSADGNHFTSVGKISQYTATTMGMYDATITISPVKARYAKIIAKNSGNIPDGDNGAGNPSWLFADEIKID